MSKINYWTTYSILGVLVVVVGLFIGFVYEHNQQMSEKELSEQSLAEANGGSKSVPTVKPKKVEDMTEDDAWNVVYPNTIPMEIASNTVAASIAETWAERIQGLSGTPYLPMSVVKLFIFDTSDLHSIWMKDMNYSIDIIWVNDAEEIVYIAKEVSPDSYPESFTTEVPAKYVIETAAGFVDEHDIKLGDAVTVPKRR